MNKGQYETQINRAWEILKKLELDGSRILHPIYPENAAAQFRALNYVQVWQKCYSEKYFHFELTDHSLLQFRVEQFEPLCVSYSYYESPYYPAMTFEDFMADLGELTNGEDEFVLRDEYENYVNQMLKEMCTPIRYDFDPSCYVEGRHPASHIHLGHKNNVRVGTSKMLRPLSFVFFVLRQCYPDAWQQLTTSKDAETLVREVSENLDDVQNHLKNKMDSWEMILS